MTEPTPIHEEATMADQNTPVTANPTLVVAEGDETAATAEDAPEAPAPATDTDTDTNTNAEAEAIAAEDKFFSGEEDPKAKPEDEKKAPGDELDAIEALAGKDDEEPAPTPEEVTPTEAQAEVVEEPTATQPTPAPETHTEAQAEVVEEVPEPPAEAVQAEVVPNPTEAQAEVVDTPPVVPPAAKAPKAEVVPPARPTPPRARPTAPTAPVAAAVAAAAVDILIVAPRGPAGPQGPQGPAGKPPTPTPPAPAVITPNPPPRKSGRKTGCLWLALLALVALLALGLLGLGGGIATWFATRPAPAPTPVVTAPVMDGGVLNGALMCADGWNEGSVVNTGSLVHTTVPTGIDGVYQIVELRNTTQDAQGRCVANGAIVQASNVLTAVRAHPAGTDISMGGYTLVGFGTQRF